MQSLGVGVTRLDRHLAPQQSPPQLLLGLALVPLPTKGGPTQRLTPTDAQLQMMTRAKNGGHDTADTPVAGGKQSLVRPEERRTGGYARYEDDGEEIRIPTRIARLTDER